MGRPYTFPDPSKRSQHEAGDSCTTAKVVGLYNQAHGTNRSNYSEEIGKWFIAEAMRHGWQRPVKTPTGFNLTAEVRVIHAQQANTGSNGNVVPLQRRQASN